MFNEEQKLRFIRSVSTSASYQRNLATPLKFAEPFENEWGDISTWTEAQLSEFLKKRNFSSISTARGEIGSIRRYYRWCADQNLIDNCDQVEHLNAGDFVITDNAENKMVKSPAALADFLDKYFKSAPEICAFRFYYWLAFMGFAERDVVCIMRDNADLDGMVIRYADNEYQIFPESLPDIKELCEQNGGETPLIQTFDSTLEPQSFSRRSTKYLNKVQSSRLSYHNVKKSGLFYRVYQQELKGFPVRFDTETSRLKYEYSGWGDTLAKCKSEYDRANYLQRYLLQEYNLWKAAFGIVIDNKEERRTTVKTAAKHIAIAKQIIAQELGGKPALDVAFETIENYLRESLD